MTDNELNGLIRLLDDPDNEVFQIIEKNLLDRGISVVSELEKAWENSTNHFIHSRIENIIHKIQFTDVKENLQKWLKSSEKNLLEGAFYIARYQYPDLSYETLREQMARIKNDIWRDILKNLTPLEQVRYLNHVIYHLHHFIGNTTNFFSPQNSYINLVLETRKGNSISLSIIYLLIAQEFGLPIFGVNLPKNFILCYKNEINSEILFYINPFNRGLIVFEHNIKSFLEEQKISEHKSFYEPCVNEAILHRLMLNLISSYQKLNISEKIDDLQTLERLFDPKALGYEL